MLTRDDKRLKCQAAVHEPPHARRGGHWRPCTRWSRVAVIHRQDGQPIALCGQHARIHAKDVLTPLIRWASVESNVTKLTPRPETTR